MKIKHKKLTEWVNAGLITFSQGQDIHAYEEKKRSGHFGRGLVGLALFAILMGVLSIIASNWYLIPGEVKIGTHVLINLAVGFLAFWSEKKGRDLWREGASLAFIGLTFTLIILIGQIYQLDGSAADAVIFWFLITLPFFLLMGKTLMTAVPWMILFLTTLSYVFFDKLTEIFHDGDLQWILLAGASLVPLSFLAIGSSRHVVAVREQLADVFLRTGFILTALTATFSLALWQFYGEASNAEQTVIGVGRVLAVLGAGLAGLAAHALYYKFYRDGSARKAVAIFALVSLLSITIPLLFPAMGGPILGALLFIGYWMLVGWIAQFAGKMRIVSFAILLIALRIFFVYVQLFGSLMSTGLGLISGGLVLLALLYAARKTSVYLQAKD